MTPRFVDDAKIKRSSVDDITEGKIVGGNDTTIEEHPYQLSFRKNKQHNCGGSVLTATRALTSAHCLTHYDEPSMYSIKAGSTFEDVYEDSKAQIRALSRFIIHPKYDWPDSHAYDIAILHFQQPLIFGANVQPLALPPANCRVPYGQLGTVSEWGMTRDGDPDSSPNRLQAGCTIYNQ